MSGTLQYNGISYATTLTITKGNGGTNVATYPRIYNIQLLTVTNSEGVTVGFPVSGLSALTSSDFAALSELAYRTRVSTFVTEVESEEPGYDHDTNCSTNEVKPDSDCTGAAPPEIPD